MISVLLHCTFRCFFFFFLIRASSLKQESAGRHVAPLGHIIMIPSKPVFVGTPRWCMFNGEAAPTNFIVFSLTRLEPELTI